jgi:hypothetical protein
MTHIAKYRAYTQPSIISTKKIKKQNFFEHIHFFDIYSTGSLDIQIYLEDDKKLAPSTLPYSLEPHQLVQPHSNLTNSNLLVEQISTCQAKGTELI